MKTRLNGFFALILTTFLSTGGMIATAQAQTVTPTTDETPAAENTTPGKLTVELSGTATANSDTDLQITPAVFDSGLIEIGNAKTQNIIVRHAGAAGSAPGQINAADLIGANPDEYTVNFDGFRTLFPGDEFPVTVTFTPTAPGDKSAGLSLAVEGLTAPVVLMFQGQSRYPLTSDIQASTKDINFGSSLTGTSKTEQVTLTNDGEAGAPAVNIGQFKLTGLGANAFATNFQPKVLQPGQSMTIAVTLKAPGSGFKQAEALVVHDGNNDNIVIKLQGTKFTDGLPPPEFNISKLNGASITRGTSAQFGPDNKLYVTELSGAIKIYSINRLSAQNYQATLETTITSVQATQNHNDDGSVANGPNVVNKRLVTGLRVVGTAANPVIYVASSDPRMAAGPEGTDSGLDTNSGILHKLTKTGNTWQKFDLVRGLPRSEENHVPNGIEIVGNKLYLITGGNTNEGAPSNNFALTPEYALSAAVLEIDLAAIGNTTYDLPTLDDEDRPGVNDNNDPFGGNDGKNQAKLIPSSPVKVFATGYRNAYDILQHSNGKMYTIDNGPNAPWGGPPIGNCSNQVSEGGTFYPDQLHIVTQNAYGGHPNPTRGSKNNKFNSSNPQSPIEGPAMPNDCNYKPGGQGDGALATLAGSYNGFTEYTASSFNGQVKGDLIVVSYFKKIVRIALTANGNGITALQPILENFGDAPLDVTTQGDGQPFPGTIWVIDNLANDITVMEPAG